MPYFLFYDKNLLFYLGSSSSSGHRRLPLQTRKQSMEESSPSHNLRSPPTSTTADGLDSLETVYYNHLVNGQNNLANEDNIKLEDTRRSVQSQELDLNLNTQNESNSAKVVPDKKISPVQQPKISPWSCRHCTFKNKVSERICEMCSKTKDFVLEESEDDGPIDQKAVPKLYSEPKVATPKPTPKPSSNSSNPDMIPCPRCTLLNGRIRFECEACGYRLRNANSPKGFV